MPEGYMTTQQVADFHNVTRGCVVQWIQSEKDPLPAEKINQVWLVKESDAKAYKRKPITGRPRRNPDEESSDSLR